MQSLAGVTMRMASGGKRFFHDMSDALRINPEFQMTVGQAKFLWSLVHLYRKQIGGRKLREIAEKLHFGEEIPEIFELADHRIVKARKVEVVHPQKKTRLDEELEKGEGKLRL